MASYELTDEKSAATMPALRRTVNHDAIFVDPVPGILPQFGMMVPSCVVQLQHQALLCSLPDTHC